MKKFTSAFDFVIDSFFEKHKSRKKKCNRNNKKVTVTWPGHEHTRRRLRSNIGDYDLLTATFIDNIKNRK